MGLYVCCVHPCPLKTCGGSLFIEAAILKRVVAFSLLGLEMDIDMQLVRKRYNEQKLGAKRRGIEFNLTFDEWWGIWRPYWSNRGRNVGNYVMCRTMDSGAYEVGNVRIDTVKGNAHTRSIVAFDSRMQQAKLDNSSNSLDEESDDEEDGWLPRHLRNPYRSSCNSW